MTPIKEIYSTFLRFPSITTDSRNVTKDSIFFAMKGNQFDGNLFAADALDNGAAYAVVDDPDVIKNNHYILVDDVLATLQKLAMFHRENIKAEIIGITGSNGKTTTKELCGKVLGSVYNTITTKGNLNNHIGVPLTILTITKEHDFAVVEMGANHIGEIAELCKIARPDAGLITNIGKAHLEGFGGFEGVIKAKTELYDYIRNNDGLVFINADNPLLKELSADINSFSYGSDIMANCQGYIINQDPYLSLSYSYKKLNSSVNTNLYGAYNLENIMAAICIGLYYEVSPEKINLALSNYVPDNNRSQVIKTGKNVLMLDAYNANPSSTKTAIENFSLIKASSKMIILGDMAELGDYSHEEHLNIVNELRRFAWDKVILIGKFFSLAAAGGNELCFSNTDEAGKWIARNPVNGMTILIKGSRVMKLEKLRELL